MSDIKNWRAVVTFRGSPYIYRELLQHLEEIPMDERSLSIAMQGIKQSCGKFLAIHQYHKVTNVLGNGSMDKSWIPTER